MNYFLISCFFNNLVITIALHEAFTNFVYMLHVNNYWFFYFFFQEALYVYKNKQMRLACKHKISFMGSNSLKPITLSYSMVYSSYFMFGFR